MRVTVVSTIRTQPPMVADELRRQADFFLDLAELQGRGRAASTRPAMTTSAPAELPEDDDDAEFDDEAA